MTNNFDNTFGWRRYHRLDTTEAGVPVPVIIVEVIDKVHCSQLTDGNTFRCQDVLT